MYMEILSLKKLCLYGGTGSAIWEAAKQLWPQSGDVERRLAPLSHMHTAPGSLWMVLVFVCRNPSYAKAPGFRNTSPLSPDEWQSEREAQLLL